MMELFCPFENRSASPLCRGRLARRLKIQGKIALCLALFTLLHTANLPAQSPDFASLKKTAESFYADGSYARANKLYAEAKELKLAEADRRWVEFRLADTLWRSQAATKTFDSTEFDRARKQLEALVRDVDRPEDRDRVWVEVQESLGDFFWARDDQHDWNNAWPHYQAALDWWAGAADIETARARYLAMVWKCARPPASGHVYFWAYYGNSLPLAILENTARIATTETDKAHAHLLLALALSHQGEWEQIQRVPGELQAAIKPGKSTDWYDGALFQYAQWMENRGHAIPLQDGSWRAEPDYNKALELYKKLAAEFRKGESPYYDQAIERIKQITEPTLEVSLRNYFLPDSEIQYVLSWRNVKKIKLTLYPVNLASDVRLGGDKMGRDDWLQSIDLAGREAITNWTWDTKDKGNHEPGQEERRLDGKLPAGAYVLAATADGRKARDLLLVSDATLILKTAGTNALVYVCDALAGAPIPAATVHLWEGDNDGKHWRWRDNSKVADSNGVAVFDLAAQAPYEQIFAAASSGHRQAIGSGNRGWRNRDGGDGWRIYACSDRPAYRPGETAQWKFTARTYDGSSYTTPSGIELHYEITDPRGSKVNEGTATLNTFGSAWGALELKDTMVLGEYRISFWNRNKDREIGSATLFRLEEYKLPEFKVSVKMPEENGKKKVFRLGDSIEAVIQADYYFGGGVPNADVEVVVYEKPLYLFWHWPHDFSWYYEDMNLQSGRNWGGSGQVVKREKIKTDATGRASFTFDTPRNQNQDLEYHIEARVTDASRREITGEGITRVTRQRYYVYPRAGHNLYRPQDKVTLEFKAADANEQPVQTEGTVRITRDYWYEIWFDPDGREVKGDELKRLQSRGAVFPPIVQTNQRPWQLKFRGYEHDDILTRTVKTGTNGLAELSFTPEREGYYRAAWSSEIPVRTNERPEAPITAQTTVWVATGATSDIGYNNGGLEIIVDKDTFRVGEKTPIMLSAPVSDRYALFTIEGQNLQDYRLIHLDGAVKLVELDVREEHVPNIFLCASMVSDRQIYSDTKQVIVPPTKNFLSVEVKPDRDQYLPREQGTFTITTRNDRGEPQPAEVAFGLVDESVFYIQSDYAGDPRQFFFGTKRPHTIETTSSFNQKSYAKLLEGDNHRLIDIRDLERIRRDGNGSARNRFKDAEASATYAIEKEASIGGFGGPVTRQNSKSYLKSESDMSARTIDAPMAPAAQSPAPAPGQSAPVSVQVRSDFRSTVFWQPDVMTGADGKATVKVTYPDSLTGWKATARAVTAANQFGIAQSGTRTKQPLIVRLEAPRFFLVGDTVTVSAVVNNNTGEAISAEVELDPDFPPHLSPREIMKKNVRVPANGEARADWSLPIRYEGEATLKVVARGGGYADAMEKRYPVFEHGIEKFISRSGKVRGDDVTVKLNLPAARKAGTTSLVVQVTPSMAVTMLDALPYLIDYPYGCTEQTMSRFLPAAITARTLKNLGLKPADIEGHLFGGIEAGTAAATHPSGSRDLRKLDDITGENLKRLYDFQHADGGWGWWKEDATDRFMTAYVVWGLSLARDAGIAVKGDVLNRGGDYLRKSLVDEQDHYDMQAWMLHAVSAWDRSDSAFIRKAVDNLWKHRDDLNAYTRALFALSEAALGDRARAKTLVENLENGVKRDDHPDTSVVMPGAQQSGEGVIGTAHWGEDGIYWRWSEGGVEATAFALRALLAIDPGNKLIEPVSNWLIRNRRGAQWSNTRDTAIVVLAMTDYLRKSGELASDTEYEVLVNGKSIASKKVSRADILAAPSRFSVDPKLVQDGENDIHILRRGGKGPVYFSANATFFSEEEPIKSAGNEIFVRRQYYKLIERPTLLKGYVTEREPLNDGGTIKSGERVESVITIEAKNNYEYLLFEDLKPSGFETVAVRSGEMLNAFELKSGAVDKKLGVETNSATAPRQAVRGRAARQRILSSRGAPLVVPRPGPAVGEDFTGRSRAVYQELRDRKAALFIDHLPQGIWQISYEMRAEVPGQFHALPVVGHAMYVPEIRCNGEEIRLTVQEGK